MPWDKQDTKEKLFHDSIHIVSIYPKQPGSGAEERLIGLGDEKVLELDSGTGDPISRVYLTPPNGTL